MNLPGLPELALLVSVCGTPPGFARDSSNCALPDLGHPQVIVKVRLYRALRWGDGVPVLRDSLPATGGIEACFTGIDSTIQATYWQRPVNVAGVESICDGPGLSFPRTVDVPRAPGDDSGQGVQEIPGELFDLRGARVVQAPAGLPDGIYFHRTAALVERIVVVGGKVVGRRQLYRRRAAPLGGTHD